jgi:hypothetical protein
LKATAHLYHLTHDALLLCCPGPQTTIYTWPAFGATLGIGVLLGAGTFVLQRRSPDPAVLPTCVVWKVDLVATGYTLVGFVTGVLWIASIANELVSRFNALGVL